MAMSKVSLADMLLGGIAMRHRELGTDSRTGNIFRYVKWVVPITERLLMQDRPSQLVTQESLAHRHEAVKEGVRL